MNRSTNILGFSLLAVAATLAAMITVRNTPTPGERHPARRTQAARTEKSTQPGKYPPDGGASGRSRNHDAAMNNRIAGRQAAHSNPSASFDVSLPEDWLSSLPAEQQADWQSRVDAVGRSANMQLAQLTEKLDLTSAQRHKLFPALVRAAAGYDPVMNVGGSPVSSDVALTPTEEIHAALEPDQQAQVEDEEVNRQLWWQDIIDRLEADLLQETGGTAIETAAGISGEFMPSPGGLPPADEERNAPTRREDMNLFDMMEPAR